MGHFEAFIYGLIQGATEYLPISSSAHLVLLPHLFQDQDPGLAFDVFLHLGTLLATLIYFFREWIEVLKTPVPKKASLAEGGQRHLSWLHFIIATLPAVIVGSVLNHWIQDHTRSLMLLGITMPIFGVVLWAVDKHFPSTRTITDASLLDMLKIGCMQCLAMIPGVSRSGSTITAARLLGFERTNSARISFLISMPVTLGAVVFEARHFHELADSMSIGLGPLVLAATTTIAVGALAIHGLIKWLGKANFTVFAIYRICFGLFIAWMYYSGMVN